MQLYAGFPILTNQPWTPYERRDLHDLIDYVQPDRVVTAAGYAADAQPLIEGQLRTRAAALVVGGSGLYMRAALAPLSTLGPSDPERRKLLEERALKEGAVALHADLAARDPEAATSIDWQNTRRVIRALEAVADGRSWSGRGDLWEPAYGHPTLIVGLAMERATLSERILLRTERMLQEGAVEEVWRFCELYEGVATRPAGQGITCAIGYEQIWRFVAGEQGYGETVEQIAAATRSYVRRQSTWLRKVRGAVMIDVQRRGAGDIAEEILALVDIRRGTKESDRP